MTPKEALIDYKDRRERHLLLFHSLSIYDRILIQVSFAVFLLATAMELIHDYRFEGVSGVFTLTFLALVMGFLLIIVFPKRAPYLILRSFRLFVIIVGLTIFALYRDQNFDWLWFSRMAGVIIALISFPSHLRFYRLRSAAVGVNDV